MRLKLGFLVFLGAFIALFSGGHQSMAQDARYEGRVPAPEFALGLDWVNTDSPLSIAGLKGKVIVLDFWTYGCINCIHMIPILRQLEERFPNEVVVIGVHSAKFSNEGETENIRQIVQRYNIHHPVINDKDFVVWRLYGARAWPTLAIIDPFGRLVASDSGEIPFDILEAYVGGMIAYYDGQGADIIDRTPLALALEGAGNPGTPLLYPGKVLADEASNRLFIADTNHHRIVIADLTTYAVLDIIGTGTRGFTEGDYATAQFDQPQGMALSGETLYIADVNNHAIRAVDLTAQTVRTIAGNGIMSPTLIPFGTVVTAPTQTALRSPWAVEIGATENELHIAMAGMHQLHVMDLAQNTLTPSVGNAREAMKNASLADSELAQPSGLFYVDGLLYFADSESSTVRVADFNADEVRLISGTSENNLFDYGDIDGVAGTNRLQHALSVTGTPDGSTLYIADTYNSKIKLYDPQTNETRTLFGLGGLGGFRDGNAEVAEFDEPGGISYSAGKLYVADTNNHAIRIIDLATNTVSTVIFPNAEKLALREVVVIGGNQTLGETLTLEAQTVQAGNRTLEVSINLPEGYKINPLIESFVALSSESISRVTTPITASTLSVPVTLTEADSTLTLELTIYYCEAENESICLIDDSRLIVPLTIRATGAETVSITRQVALPR